MHKSSIGLLVCLKCGNTLQPSEAAKLDPDAAVELQNQPETLYSKDPYAAPQPSPYYAAMVANPTASYDPVPLESYLEAAPGQSETSISAVVLSKLAGVSPTQKKIALGLLGLVFVISAIGGFFGYNDYQTTKTLEQGIAQDSGGKFDEAGGTLAKANKGIAYPGTKKAIDKEIANNKRWKEYFTWQKQAEDLINSRQFAAALELLYKINNDYPLYAQVTNMIAIAEAGGVITDTSAVAVDTSSAATSIGTSSTPVVANGGGTRIIPYTPGSGGGTRPVTPPKPVVTPTPATPPKPPITSIPAPTKYIYKGDNKTNIGTFVGYNGSATCSSIIYKSGSIQRQLTSSDCAVENALQTGLDWMYYPNTTCSGNSGWYPSAGISNVYIGMQFYYRGQVWQITSTNAYGNIIWSMYINSACNRFSAASSSSAYPAVYARMPYTASNTLCGSAAPCVVR